MRLYSARTPLLALMIVTAWCLPAGFVLSAEDGPAPPVEWRWPGAPKGPCAGQNPDAVLAAYMEDDREAAGRHKNRDCGRNGSGGLESRFLVASSFRFVKRFKLLPPFDVAVDHQRIEVRTETGVSWASSFVKGSAACTRFIWGECRLEYEPLEDGGGVFRRIDEDGVHEVEAPQGTAVDDLWRPEVVAAPALVNLYTGRLWRMTPDPDGVTDPVGGRAATRHHIKSHIRGVFWLTSFFERVMWFAAEGPEKDEVLRVCDFQQDFGFTHVSEFVREDLGVMPKGDCARFF